MFASISAKKNSFAIIIFYKSINSRKAISLLYIERSISIEFGELSI